MGRSAKNYRLLKQLELASEAGVCIRPVVIVSPSAQTNLDDVFQRPYLPKAPCLGLTSFVDNVHADPHMLGEKRPISAVVYHCLAELGITSLPALVCKNRRRRITLDVTRPS